MLALCYVLLGDSSHACQCILADKKGPVSATPASLMLSTGPVKHHLLTCHNPGQQNYGLDIFLLQSLTLCAPQSILVQLRQDDEMQQLDGLGQLCELLSVSTEESLSVVPVESLVPVLVSHQADCFPVSRKRRLTVRLLERAFSKSHPMYDAMFNIVALSCHMT